VTKAVHDRKFQLLNYAKSMKYSSNLARWIHKRISHKFVQASWNNTYQIKLSSIIRDSGITSYAQFRNNLREAKKALDEMVEFGVLRSYDDTNRKLDGKRIIDVTFELRASHEFVAEMKKSHALKRIGGKKLCSSASR
jgi:hypothetical protein